MKALQASGIPYNPDFNGTTQYGAGFYQVTCRDGWRRSSAVSYLHPVRCRKNLSIRTGARVNRIIVENGRAIGVEVMRGRTTEKIFTNREVILSSGAINTPRLLLLSGVGPANELAKLGMNVVHNLKGVGKNLQDHLCTNIHLSLKDPISYDGQDRFPYALWHGLQWLLYRTGPAASVVVEGGAFTKSSGAKRPDLQIHVAPAMLVKGGRSVSMVMDLRTT